MVHFILNTLCSEACSPNAVHECTLPMLSLFAALLILFVMVYFGSFYFEHFVFRCLLALRGTFMHHADALFTCCSFDIFCYGLLWLILFWALRAQMLAHITRCINAPCRCSLYLLLFWYFLLCFILVSFILYTSCLDVNHLIRCSFGLSTSHIVFDC